MPIPLHKASSRWTFTIPPNIEQLRHWHSYALIGNARHDAAMLRAAEEQLARFGARRDYRTGIRIDFGSHSRYGQLTTVLDLMLRYDIKQYMLDIYRSEPVLYVWNGHWSSGQGRY
ncbi:hypothetical protein [Hymenobacter sp. CRA2]|uniref:hypothetical protein n=1 Tax=Hymenobacter sp. CRA2 TaxID=1955620 RepID=UPI0011166A14|nr:hypothetical protein [Hymenobacter sp. CRA2]